jgi:ABC-type polysaccharide/polyol phosphate transport system ATPase subunit
MAETVIQLENVSVSYLHNKRGIYSVKDFVLKGGLFSPFEHKTVLHNINLDIKRGESVAIMGRNGEGKTTLLRLIAGILKPDEGKYNVNIPISPVLALGVGLELELTGIENIKIYMALSGQYNKKTIDGLIDGIANFSELSIEQLRLPVKMYSTGMLARLAFSSVVATQPQLLLIDEVLSVGDLGFQEKCKKRIHDIKTAGATVLFVSHDSNAVKEICERGICLSNGSIAYDGPAENVVAEYSKLFS